MQYEIIGKFNGKYLFNYSLKMVDPLGKNWQNFAVIQAVLWKLKIL